MARRLGATVALAVLIGVGAGIAGCGSNGGGPSRGAVLRVLEAQGLDAKTAACATKALLDKVGRADLEKLIAAQGDAGNLSGDLRQKVADALKPCTTP